MKDTYTLDELLDVAADYTKTAYQIEQTWKTAGVAGKAALEELVEDQHIYIRGMLLFLVDLTGEDLGEVMHMVANRTVLDVFCER